MCGAATNKTNGLPATSCFCTALKAFEDQQNLVDQLTVELEDAQKALAETKAEKRYADLRARERAKAVKEVERKLKKKAADEGQ